MYSNIYRAKTLIRSNHGNILSQAHVAIGTKTECPESLDNWQVVDGNFQLALPERGRLYNSRSGRQNGSILVKFKEQLQDHHGQVLGCQNWEWHQGKTEVTGKTRTVTSNFWWNVFTTFETEIKSLCHVEDSCGRDCLSSWGWFNILSYLKWGGWGSVCYSEIHRCWWTCNLRVEPFMWQSLWPKGRSAIHTVQLNQLYRHFASSLFTQSLLILQILSAK